MPYVESSTIRLFAEASDSSNDTVWNILAASASLVFDRAANVPEKFFAPAAKVGYDYTISDKVFDYQRSGFYRLPPYVGDLTVSTNADGVLVDPANYYLRDGYLVFPDRQYNPFDFVAKDYFKISAAWGFVEVPADIQQAVIEQALFMFRRKDQAFAELSGVSTAAVTAQLSPTCALVAEKYRQIYLQIGV